MPKGVYLTKEQVAEIVRDYSAGMLCVDIATKHSVSIATTSRLPRLAGLVRSSRLTASQRKEVADAYAAGDKIEAIAAKYGKHGDSIVAVARRAGIVPRPSGRSPNTGARV